jgi:hypothetical protein
MNPCGDDEPQSAELTNEEVERIVGGVGTNLMSARLPLSFQDIRSRLLTPPSSGVLEYGGTSEYGMSPEP